MHKKRSLLPLSLLIIVTCVFATLANAKSLQQIQQENNAAAINSAKSQQAFQQRVQQMQQEYAQALQETKANQSMTGNATPLPPTTTSSNVPSTTQEQTTTTPAQPTYTTPTPAGSTTSAGDSLTGFGDSNNNQQQNGEDNSGEWQYGF